MTTFVDDSLTPNAVQQDTAATFGSGGYGIGYGLALSLNATPLLLNVSAGVAMLGGPVIIDTAATLAIPDNHFPGSGLGLQDRVWIWLKQDKTLQYSFTTAPPAGIVCLLGSVTTMGGVISSIDMSGVLTFRGGILVRQTADLGQPGDTPPATIAFFTRVQGGAVYLWDGTGYSQLSAAAASAVTQTSTNTDLQSQIDNNSAIIRALVLRLVDILGDDIIATDELSDLLDAASQFDGEPYQAIN